MRYDKDYKLDKFVDIANKNISAAHAICSRYTHAAISWVT